LLEVETSPKNGYAFLSGNESWLGTLGTYFARWGLAPTFGIKPRLLSGWTKAHPYERIALAVE